MLEVERSRRSLLFAGALSPDDIDAALASGADEVCVDMEDAVSPAEKGRAREAVASLLKRLGGQASRVVVRINQAATLDGVRDLGMLLDLALPPVGLVLPKIETAADVAWVDRLLENTKAPHTLYGIIETPEALENAASLARVAPRLEGLIFGAYDLSTALGCSVDWEPLLYARSRVVHAAAGAGIGVFDAPSLDIADDDVRLSTERGRALGMTGRIAKHPSHVDIINAVYTPSAEEIEQAREILSSFDRDPTRPVVFDGRLIELPSIKALRKVAVRALPKTG